MIDLSSITLCAVSSIKIEETISAINACKKYCNFKNIIFFSDQDVPYGQKINKINNIQDYNSFILNTLPDHISQEDYVLTIQWDGFIVNHESWSNDFLNYDYIGAPWPWINNICGNGGFCLKSKRFFQIQKQILVNYENKNNHPEDLLLCYHLRSKFIKFGCKYAPPEIAYKFAIEYKNPNYDIDKPFGFHDLRVNPQYKLL